MDQEEQLIKARNQTEIERLEFDPDLLRAIRLGMEVEDFMRESPVGIFIYNRAMMALSNCNDIIMNAPDLEGEEVKLAHQDARVVMKLLDWLNDALTAAKEAETQLEEQNDDYRNEPPIY